MIIKNADIEKAKHRSSFTKYDSMLVKGVAIILLMFHHSISMTEVERHTLNFFPFNSYHWPVMVCDSFKLVVGMFIFITGFGLYKSFSKVELNKKSVFNWTCIYHNLCSWSISAFKICYSSHKIWRQLAVCRYWFFRSVKSFRYTYTDRYMVVYECCGYNDCILSADV